MLLVVEYESSIVEAGPFCFRRRYDGAVVVQAIIGDAPVAVVAMDPQEWAEVVASVSARGLCEDAQSDARQVHGLTFARPIPMPHVKKRRKRS